MSTLDLAWKLVRAGRRFRILAIVAGNAIGTTLFLLTVAIPTAIHDPNQAVTSDERLLAMSVVVVLSLPITVLLMSIGRLSASTRDRRLASLRMLGLTPARTRTVAGLENGILSLFGVAVGLMASFVVMPKVDSAATRQGWLLQPLHLSWVSTGRVCAGLVLLSVVVSLAPTRVLQRRAMQVRRVGVIARPSVWRLLPVILGIGLLVIVLVQPEGQGSGVMSQNTTAIVTLAGAWITGIGLLIALPVAVRGGADLISHYSGGITTQLAARRLQSEPAGTVRLVSGLTISLFLITCSSGVLAATQSSPQYVAANYAYEHGPQRHQISTQSAPTSDIKTQMETFKNTVGVQAVIPDYGIELGGCQSQKGFCGNLFVGTCADLMLLQPTPGCRDDMISLISPRTPASPTEGLPIELVNNAGERVGVTASPQTLLTSDADWAQSSLKIALFVPIASSQITSLVAGVTRYDVLTGPGQTPRTAVQTTANRLGVNIFLEPLDEYEAAQGYQLLFLTLAVVILGIGLLAVLITTIDRAIERRRQVAGQVALGVPIRVLRGSQILQTVFPLWIGVVPAIGLGYLTVIAYLKMNAMNSSAVIAPTGTIQALTLAVVVGVAVVAVSTLPGIGRRLTPDLLRRE